MDFAKMCFVFGDCETVLLILNSRKIVRKPRIPRPIRFKLSSDHTDSFCEFNFRFTSQELPRLKSAFGIPNKMHCTNGTSFTGIEGLCVMLRRLAYPNRLGDLTLFFNRTKSELSMIFNSMVDFMLMKFGHLLTSCNLFWLSQDDLKKFSESYVRRGAPLKKSWGIIDGTIRGICRPSKNQRIVYNGHKRIHALKFQAIVTPNGLIANLFGPVEGRRHDCFLLTESCLLSKIQNFRDIHGNAHYLYGDPAYPLRPQLMGPFKGAAITQDQAAFNKAMSTVRISVEWEFGKVSSLFAFLDFKKNLKLYLQPVGKLYQAGALLSNCHTCLRGSQTSKFFDLNPPDLEKYLSNTA